MSEILVKAQEHRKKYAERVDSYYADIEASVPHIIEESDPDKLWSYRDNFEEIKAKTYKMSKSVSRNRAEVFDNYKDSLRNSMAKTNNAGGLHYSEREARYEMANITEYKIINNLDRIIEDLDRFVRYLEGRLMWIKERQRFLQDKTKFG
jgi:hypothetical protein